MRVKTALFAALIPSAAFAIPVNPVYQDGPQDPLFLGQDQWHELGDFFPVEELIQSTWTFTELTSCFDGNDDPLIPNIMVVMTNLSPIRWQNLHYVADIDTFITNYDGWIGDIPGAVMGEAFKIDYPGINRPLVFESIAADQIFEPGETWQFIIQDFSNALGGPPAPFDSIGIAGSSVGFPPSTGSIIAQVVPGAGTLPLLAIGGIAALRRRR
jgi:hypothetical protein